jgi:carboxymethylenebutenolidase
MRALRDAVTFAREQLRGDDAPVGVIGFSLGAYLALSEAAEDGRVHAVVDCFGGLPDLFAPALQRMPPVLILHGTSDPIVPVAEAHKLEKLLAAGKLPFETHLYPGVGHGFQGPVLHDACQRAASFLERHLREPEREPSPA